MPLAGKKENLYQNKWVGGSTIEQMEWCMDTVGSMCGV